MKKLNNLVLVFLSTLLLISCGGKDPVNPIDPPVKKFTIGVTCDASVVSQSTEVATGGNATITGTAISGYVIDKVLVDGVAISIPKNISTFTYTISNVNANHQISFTSRKLAKFVVEISIDPNITSNYSGSVEAYEGSNLTINFTFAPGYEADVVKVNDTIKSLTNNSYTFSSIAANQKLVVTSRVSKQTMLMFDWTTCYMKNHLIGNPKWYAWYPPIIPVETYSFDKTNLRIYDSKGTNVGGGAYTMVGDSIIRPGYRYGVVLTSDTLKLTYKILAYLDGQRDPVHDGEETDVFARKK